MGNVTDFLTGPVVILGLKVAVSLVTVILLFAGWAAWKKKYQLHGRINMLFFGLTVTALILFEVIIRLIKPDIYEYLKADPVLFPRLKIHLAFAIPSALLMPLMMWTGLRKRTWHRKINWLFAVLWTLTFLTGVFFLPHVASAAEFLGLGISRGVTNQSTYYSGGQHIRVLWQSEPGLKTATVVTEREVAIGADRTPARMRNVVAAAPATNADRLKQRLSALPGFMQMVDAEYLGDAVLARFKSPELALDAANQLLRDGEARFAHPDFVFDVEPRGPDLPWQEPMLPMQWHMDQNGTLDAWRILERRAGPMPEVIVAVLDLGFESSHHELEGAWLVNSGEIPGNKRDDDGNGLVDDVAGWNFATNSSNLIYGASNKHGTATAGIVGARGNGAGVTGACPWCRVLPVVIDGSAIVAASGFRYAHARGARIFSNSWGYRLKPPTTDLVLEAIREVARDSVVVFAMSNSASNDCRESNPDISSHEDVIAVSSVEESGFKVPQSGYGPCMEIVAPSSGGPQDPDGHGIVTTDRVGQPGYNTGTDPTNLPDADYTNSFWGTSAAAPQVAAAAALVKSAAPQANPARIKQVLFDSAAKVGGADAGYDANGFSEKYGYGRLDVGRAVELVTGDR